MITILRKRTPTPRKAKLFDNDYIASKSQKQDSKPESLIPNPSSTTPLCCFLINECQVNKYYNVRIA